MNERGGQGKSSGGAPGRRRVRVRIVDDSALVRSVLERALNQDADVEVVGSARNPYEARDLLVQLRPDVMTLDIEMPRLDGISFLRKFMAVVPTPTVVLSSLASEGSELAKRARSGRRGRDPEACAKRRQRPRGADG